jgi:hypothetical protein
VASHHHQQGQYDENGDIYPDVETHDVSSAITEDDLNSAEEEGLISQYSGDQSVGGAIDDYFYYGFTNAEASVDWRCAIWLVVSFLFITCLAVILPGQIRKPIVEADGTVIFPNGTIEKNGNNVSHVVYYDCPDPNNMQGGENYHNTSVEESYINRTSIIANNFTGFLETFHDSEFDGWGKTYSFVKAGMYHWKSTRFPKHLEDGNTIYESACGIGLNLIMTLEILQEVKGINNLYVYGNEYIPSSANASNKILDALLPDLNATKGSVCAADSTNLHYIPSHSFDLVFTGYISTLLDPLDIRKGVKENFDQYEIICAGETWQDEKLGEVAQQRQNDWFGVWVGEMIRIAKPGAPIIVEQVSYPFCEALFDWGGVDQKYWTDYAIEEYGWDVDPLSIEFEDDKLFRKRYHVFMRKNGFNATKTEPPIPSPGNDGDGR